MAVNWRAGLWGVSLFLAWPWGTGQGEAQQAFAPKSLEALVREAELVAVVSVVAVQDLPGSSLSMATLQIQEILKAPPGFTGAPVSVRFQSAVVPPGTSRMVFGGGPTYVPGERAVVFLKAGPTGSDYETVGHLLGKRTVSDRGVAYEQIGLDDFLVRIRAAVRRGSP